MIEEDSKDTITSDDLSVLRVLLHNIRGISAVSTTEFMPADDKLEE
jgi:hypothetical protein